MAQIYVKSENNNNQDIYKQEADYVEQEEEGMSQQFALPKELERSIAEGDQEGAQQHCSDDEAEFEYDSVAHYYRDQIVKDIASCSKVPSILLELIGSIFSIVNIVFAFMAFHDIAYRATGVRYREYAQDDGVQYHGEELNARWENGNDETIHIFQESAFTNWRNFVYLGLALIIFEWLPPLLRVVIVVNRAPKKINSLHSLVQITMLTCLALQDGAVSLCKNLLFTEECGIRPAMMSSISMTSASLSFVNSILKTTLFIWRSNFQNQRQVRDEMEAYTEILILEEYQWYHCIIPILSHVGVIVLSAWSLIDATSPLLVCAQSSN